ncbi:hypothetical protein ACX93W_01145 [Paenibacillus sp. CAU 1782]
MKEQGQAKQGGRSKALAITLVILVMSLMGNILLATKNIGFSQSEKVEQGEDIIANLEWIRDELAFWQTAYSEMAASNESGGDARLAAGIMAKSMSKGGADLLSLLSTAKQLQPNSFSSGPGAVSYYMIELRDLLGDISGGDGALSADEIQELEDAESSFRQLEEAVSQFHFAVKGDRLSMIRLAGGHEWLHIAARLQELLLTFTEGMTLETTDSENSQ